LPEADPETISSAFNIAQDQHPSQQPGTGAITGELFNDPVMEIWRGDNIYSWGLSTSRFPPARAANMMLIA
jgi:hypothetical protein